MASKIDFTDDVGAAVLQSPMPPPGDRFAGWTPDVVEVASFETAVGDGLIQKFLHRRDYCVAFEIRNLTSDEHAVALRLKQWLMGGSDGVGGEVAVTVGDRSAHEYDCVLRPGTVPEIVFADDRLLEFTFRVQLKHVTDTPLIADY